MALAPARQAGGRGARFLDFWRISAVFWPDMGRDPIADHGSRNTAFRSRITASRSRSPARCRRDLPAGSRFEGRGSRPAGHGARFTVHGSRFTGW